MKAILVTCPNCGATLRVSEGAMTVSCEYCGAPSSVQRRTRILERIVVPPPAAPTNLPRAVQRHSKAWFVFAIVMFALPFVVAAIVIAGVGHATRTAMSVTSSATKYVKPEDRPPTWQGTDSVLVADVNGDGTPELIGRGRRVNAGDQVMLVALDLATGTHVWQSAPIGTYMDTYRGTLVRAGDTLLLAGYTGELRAFALATGKPLWSVKLDERIAYFCEGADTATVLAVGADDVIRTVKRADGSITEKRDAPEKQHGDTPCARLPDDKVTAFDISKAAWRDRGQLGKKLGIWIDAVVSGPGGRVASGSRAKGTHVTTLVSLDRNDQERWRATATPDGLGAEGAARVVVVGEREVCIVYYGKEYRTACFAMADGQRLWDEPAPSFFENLLIIGRSLVVTANELRVHDLDTGKVRWRYE
ncbi:MAG TPA: PQQ-binding-like beta-propeller repeat protein [Kofleriaceae bacterium]|nr:PQQ-binding-like beta-propeller repeat protein [Kofleriaceae bacterium]